MRTQTLYKKATTSVPKAIEDITKRYPGVEIDGIVVKAADASEARMAKVSVGERIFVATVKHAEFPAGDGPDEDSAPPEDSAPEEPKEEPKDDAPESSEGGEKKEKKSELKGDGEGADDGVPGPEGEPKKPNKDDLLLEVLQALLMKLDGGDDPMGDPGMAEVGAPGAGEPMPPHSMKPHGPGPGGPGGPPPGPGGPAGHGAPLPPPVSKPAGPGGVAFGHYNPKAAEFSVMRRDAGEIGNRGLIIETESVYPTHRVAKITRTGLAEVNGELLDVAEAGIALLTLTKK